MLLIHLTYILYFLIHFFRLSNALSNNLKIHPLWRYGLSKYKYDTILYNNNLYHVGNENKLKNQNYKRRQKIDVDNIVGVLPDKISNLLKRNLINGFKVMKPFNELDEINKLTSIMTNLKNKNTDDDDYKPKILIDSTPANIEVLSINNTTALNIFQNNNEYSKKREINNTKNDVKIKLNHSQIKDSNKYSNIDSGTVVIQIYRVPTKDYSESVNYNQPQDYVPWGYYVQQPKSHKINIH